MKNPVVVSRLSFSPAAAAFLCAIAALLAGPFAGATDLYWDINGATANTGTTATGNWNGTATNWNDDASGTGGTPTATTTTSDILHFSSGTGLTGSFIVTVAGTQAADALWFEEGTVTLTGGTIALGSGGIQIATGRTVTLNSLLTGSAGLTKTGLGTLMLGTGNAVANAGLSGGISIREGRLVAGSVASSQNATNGQLISLGDSTGTAGATFSVNRNQNYNSDVTINAGSSGVKRISGGPGLSVAQTPSILGTIILNDHLTLGNGSGGDIGGVNLAGVIKGSKTITIDGANAYVDAATPGSIAILRGASGTDFTGDVVINRGLLRIGSTGALGTGTATVATGTGAALDLANSGTTGSSISIAGLNNGSTVGGLITNHASGTGTAVLTLAGGGSYSYGGVISDGATSKVGLTVNLSGSGSQTLTAVNSYTGPTVISGGKLILSASGSISGSSVILVGSGGSFDVSAKGGYTVFGFTGSGNVLGALSVTGQLAIGNSTGVANFSNSLTLAATSTYLYELTGDAAPGAGSADLGNVAGDLTISAGSILDLVQLGTFTTNNKFTLFAYSGNLSGTFVDTLGNSLTDGGTFSDAGGSWVIDYNDTSAGANGGSGTSYVTILATVPEPGVTVLASLALLAGLRRRR